MMVVVVMVRMCILEELNLCWFRPQTRTPKTTVSLYVIAGPLLVLPTQLLTTSNYGPNRMVNDFDLRRSFYSKRCFKNGRCSSA